MDDELKTKLNLLAYKKAQEVEDIDMDILMELVVSGGKFVYEQLKLKEQNKSSDK
jgi:hypothetical protein